MDYREKAFKAKFTCAAEHLGVEPDRIISLKLRDNVSSYEQYREMLHVLEHEAGIHWSKINGDLQGQGYCVDHDGQRILVVEHETGLEILYIVSSIASIIGLVPLVLQCWGSVRGHLRHHRAHQFQNIEIRRLDGKGNIQEDHSCGLGGPSTFPLSVVNTALSAAARIIDADVNALRNEVRSLSDRLSTVENQLVSAQTPQPKKAKKTTSKSMRYVTDKKK